MGCRAGENDVLAWTFRRSRMGSAKAAVLPGARLGAGHEVATGEHEGDGLALDRRGLGVALFRDDTDELRAQAQIVEWHAAPVHHRATHPAGPGPGSASDSCRERSAPTRRCRSGLRRERGGTAVAGSVDVAQRPCGRSSPSAAGTRRKAGPPPRRSAGVPYFRMSAATVVRCVRRRRAMRDRATPRRLVATRQRGSARRLRAQCAFPRPRPPRGASRRRDR